MKRKLLFRHISGCGAVGSALDLGSRGRWFKSSHSDIKKFRTLFGSGTFLYYDSGALTGIPYSSQYFHARESAEHITVRFIQPRKALSSIRTTLSGMTSDFRFTQPSNACHPISFTLSGIVTDVSPVQSTNAKRPILFTPRGMAIDVKPSQFPNADSPIRVILSGRLISVRLLQYLNAACPISFTVSGILTEERLPQS